MMRGNFKSVWSLRRPHAAGQFGRRAGG
jgi:hypothetical protein